MTRKLVIDLPDTPAMREVLRYISDQVCPEEAHECRMFGDARSVARGEAWEILMRELPGREP